MKVEAKRSNGALRICFEDFSLESADDLLSWIWWHIQERVDEIDYLVGDAQLPPGSIADERGKLALEVDILDALHKKLEKYFLNADETLQNNFEMQVESESETSLDLVIETLESVL